MNKKLLIIIAAMGLMLCLIILSAPKIYLTPIRGGGYRATTEPNASSNVPHLNWDFVLQRSAVILIIGGLIILILQSQTSINLRFSKFDLRTKIILFGAVLCVIIFGWILIM